MSKISSDVQIVGPGTLPEGADVLERGDVAAFRGHMKLRHDEDKVNAGAHARLRGNQAGSERARRAKRSKTTAETAAYPIRKGGRPA